MTPRPYLSYTQLVAIEKGEEYYADLYLRGQKARINRGMAKGKILAEALEKDEATGDPMTDLVASKLPRLDVRETSVRAVLKFPKLEVPLLAKPDTHTLNLEMLFEYKSGITPWTQKKVDADDQMTFYDVVLVNARKERADKANGRDEIRPTIMTLHWAPTKYDTNGRVQFTGEVQSFPTARTWAQRAKMSIRIKDGWMKIQALCEKELL